MTSRVFEVVSETRVFDDSRLVVNMVEALASPAAYFTTTFLIILSLVLLAIIRIVTRKG